MNYQKNTPTVFQTASKTVVVYEYHETWDSILLNKKKLRPKISSLIKYSCRKGAIKDQLPKVASGRNFRFVRQFVGFIISFDRSIQWLFFLLTIKHPLEAVLISEHAKLRSPKSIL